MAAQFERKLTSNEVKVKSEFCQKLMPLPITERKGFIVDNLILLF